MRDWDCIEDHILPELLRRSEQWQKEYKEPRDLGPLGNFVSLYRKARKLKTALWDSRTPPEDWREDIPTMLYEIMSDAALMLVDLTEEDDAVHRRGDEDAGIDLPRKTRRITLPAMEVRDGDR